jgi:hypothetical protein
MTDQTTDGEMADGQQGPMRDGRDDPPRARLAGAVPLYGVRRGWHPAPGLGRRPRAVPGPHDTRMPASADHTDASRATA